MTDGSTFKTQAGSSDSEGSRSPALFYGVRKRAVRAILTLHGLGAFGLITLGVFVRKLRVAPRVIRPLVTDQVHRAAVRLLPLVLLMSMALGLVVIGQSVSLLTRVGAETWLGTVMVAVVVRELGPLLTALLVLARSGTANVIELGTARALGEVESLEAAGIDPIHYLVVPRVIGLALGIFSLTVYLILGAILSGYLWAFVQDIPMLPGEYFQQLAQALSALDFVVLVGKTLCFGSVIAVVTSYHGLAQPMRLEDVSGATVRAVGQSMLLCLLAETGFLALYLMA